MTLLNWSSIALSTVSLGMNLYVLVLNRRTKKLLARISAIRPRPSESK